MIQATIVTQSMAEPIALVSASVLNAAVLQELHARTKNNSASTIHATIVTQSTAEPTVLVSASLVQPVLRAAAFEELHARAKIKSASTIQVTTATPREGVPTASVSVLADPAPILCSRFAPHRNSHFAAGLRGKNALEPTRSVWMTRETVVIRKMADSSAQEFALVIHVEDLRVRSAKPDRHVSMIRETVAILTRAELIA